MSYLMRMFGNGEGVQNVNGWGTVLQAGAQVYGGLETKEAQDSLAAQMRQNAKAARAVSQRQAIDMRRRGDYVASRAQAVAAASGGGASDPTVVNTIADIKAESEFHALTAMASGDYEASGLEYGASVRNRTGRAALMSGFMGAAGTLAEGNATYRARKTTEQTTLLPAEPAARTKYGWDDTTAGKQFGDSRLFWRANRYSDGAENMDMEGVDFEYPMNAKNAKFAKPGER